MDTIGSRIKKARTTLGLTQEDLALESGTNQTLVSRMERSDDPALIEAKDEALGRVVGAIIRTPYCDVRAEFRQIEKTTRGLRHTEKVLLAVRAAIEAEGAGIPTVFCGTCLYCEDAITIGICRAKAALDRLNGVVPEPIILDGDGF